MITTQSAEKAMEKYAELMIETIEGMKGGWRKAWLTASAADPENVKGNQYNGMNAFLLLMLCGMKGYRTPVFMTMKQTNERGAKVKKGEKAFPVIYFSRMAKKAGERSISGDQFDTMTEAEQSGYHSYFIAKAYYVFNVEQTTLQEDNVELWEKITSRYQSPELKTSEGMYVNDGLDNIIANGGWICPIKTQRQDGAFYSPVKNEIVLPLKEQFCAVGDRCRAGQEFYSTALHEMAHSTHAICGRTVKGSFGSAAYGREELVAELTAAMVGNELGFSTEVQRNNAAYLKEWISAIKKQPRFLLDVISDAVSAKRVIDTAYQKATAKAKATA